MISVMQIAFPDYLSAPLSDNHFQFASEQFENLPVYSTSRNQNNQVKMLLPPNGVVETSTA
ncbi:hypothetical protein SAMN04515674_101528 [Pseudarcicella hirudinis]|uniref:Uncharacterized protein n=1 Tax=Pseudarcicella hirudinis TaxID=1079859 RepID=A0A1I5MZM2_9BACT|nr:hypothetical protein SAMN04515674_101528 [Pseudarcicella hirudinis]